MNDPDWVKCLQRAKMSQKYAIQAIHVLAPLRNEQGVAPVVLQTTHEYLRAPAHTEACFELCLRHLNRLQVPWPAEDSITVPTLLANRATQALKLPNRFVPSADGDVLDLCEHSLLAPPPSPMLCTIEHIDLTACPMLLENWRAESPASPLNGCAEWPSQDSPTSPAALTESPALPAALTESPAPAALTESPALSAALTESPALPAALTESPALSAALTESPALPTAYPTLSPAPATYLTESPTSPGCDSPVGHKDATMRADSPVSPRTTAQRGDLPVRHHNASDAAAPGKTANVASSMSKRARRRAVFKARKQQVVRRR